MDARRLNYWFDCTKVWYWNRPPVGIVRCEQAILVKAVESSGNRFFIRSLFGLREISKRQLLRKIETLEKWAPNIKAHPESLNRSKAFRLFWKKELISVLQNFLISNQGALGSFIRFLTTFYKKPNLMFTGRNLLKNGDEIVLISNEGLITGGLDKIASTNLIKISTLIYDIIPLTHPHLVPDGYPATFERGVGESIKKAQKLIFISEATKLSVNRHFGSEIFAKSNNQSVIQLGSEMSSDRLIPIPNQSEPYFLFVSTIEKRKNHRIILDAIEILAAKGARVPKFIFVGMLGWNVAELVRDLELAPTFKNSSGQNFVEVLTRVSDDELAGLYLNAQATLFPSIVEGWGLPITESLALGTPVIASDTPALVEASQGMATHISAYDAPGWARQIQLHMDPDFRAEAQRRLLNFKKRTLGDFADEFLIAVREKDLDDI